MQNETGVLCHTPFSFRRHIATKSGTSYPRSLTDTLCKLRNMVAFKFHSKSFSSRFANESRESQSTSSSIRKSI
jgi:hypothetical protein